MLSVNINKSDRVGRVTLAESEQCLIFIRHQQQLGSRAMITVLSTIFNITFIIAAPPIKCKTDIKSSEIFLVHHNEREELGDVIQNPRQYSSVIFSSEADVESSASCEERFI